MKEKKLYPIVAKWLKKQYHCFEGTINAGLKQSRADVIGIRDVGGHLSGEIETIIVEVKRGTEPFATAAGQAYGYRVYANKVYLADYRQTSFSRDEMDIASSIGIGLIQIKGTKCIEVLSSPRYEPMQRLNLELLNHEKIHLAKCQICGVFFDIGKMHTNVSRMIKKAIQNEKGFIFWSDLLNERKTNAEKHYERRYFCRDCVLALSQISEIKK